MSVQQSNFQLTTSANLIFNSNEVSSESVLNNSNENISKKTVFLIEGKQVNTSSNYPELAKVMKIAEVNGCLSFDCIQSYNREHLTHLFKKIPQDEKTVQRQQYYALSIIYSWSALGSPSDIVEFLLMPALSALVSEQYIKEVPQWIEPLAKLDKAEIRERLLSLHGNDRKSMMTNLMNFMSFSGSISNEISAEHFFKYLDLEAGVTEIYGIIGASHINFLNSFSITKAEDKPPRKTPYY